MDEVDGLLVDTLVRLRGITMALGVAAILAAGCAPGEGPFSLEESAVWTFEGTPQTIAMDANADDVFVFVVVDEGDAAILRKYLVYEKRLWLLAETELEKPPTNMVLSPSGDMLYITVSGTPPREGQIIKFDGENLKELASLPILDSFYSADSLVTRDGSLLFVGNTNNPYVYVVDTGPLELVDVITLQDGAAFGLSLSSDQSTLFVTDAFAHLLYIIEMDTSSEQIRQTFYSTPIDIVAPVSLALGRELGNVYLVGNGSDTVGVLDINEDFRVIGYVGVSIGSAGYSYWGDDFSSQGEIFLDERKGIVFSWRGRSSWIDVIDRQREAFQIQLKKDVNNLKFFDTGFGAGVAYSSSSDNSVNVLIFRRSLIWSFLKETAISG